MNARNNTSTFIFDSTETKNIQKSFNLYTSDVITINNHWSYGIFGDARNSIFSNTKLSTGARAGIEYNLFPNVI